MKQGNSEHMSLIRKTAEVVMSLAVIVMFGGLLAVTEPDEAAAEFGFVADGGAQPA